MRLVLLRMLFFVQQVQRCPQPEILLQSFQIACHFPPPLERCDTSLQLGFSGCARTILPGSVRTFSILSFISTLLNYSSKGQSATTHSSATMPAPTDGMAETVDAYNAAIAKLREHPGTGIIELTSSSQGPDTVQSLIDDFPHTLE